MWGSISVRRDGLFWESLAGYFWLLGCGVPKTGKHACTSWRGAPVGFRACFLADLGSPMWRTWTIPQTRTTELCRKGKGHYGHTGVSVDVVGRGRRG